jgi:hypothetical protein
MVIALDYHGVVTLGEAALGKLCRMAKGNGHRVVLVSAYLTDSGLDARYRFCCRYGVENRSFLTPSFDDYDETASRKSALLREVEAEAFLDDSVEVLLRLDAPEGCRVFHVSRFNEARRCLTSLARTPCV